MKKILIVDDKLNMLRMLQDVLTSDGYEIITADNGRNAIYTARHEQPDLILLDLMMPEMDGFEFLESYRKEASTPVIMLTAKHESESVVKGLALGADDYVTKPFDIGILKERIKAVLRRFDNSLEEVQVVKVKDLQLNQEMKEVKIKGTLLSLTRTEYLMIECFMLNPGRVYSRRDLLERIEGEAATSSERSVDVHIRNLRRKLEPDSGEPDYIETVFGVGYRLNRRWEKRV